MDPDIFTQPMTSDEEDSSGRDETSDGRRRRFCIERKQQPMPGGSEPRGYKRIQTDKRHHQYDRCPANKRRKFCEPRRIDHTITSSPKKEEQKGPVIFINPKFVKRFIEKSMELSSNSTNLGSKSPQAGQKFKPVATSSASTNSNPLTCMIGEIDFKTSPKELLQAASTMAIIRLVTECIENDKKRDEKLNKELISRLIEALVRHGTKAEELDDESTDQKDDLPITANDYNSEISDSKELCSSGRPIPVIGGSVNNHFKKSINGAYYSPTRRAHNANQRPKRVSNDMHKDGYSELHKNKLQNIS